MRNLSYSILTTGKRKSLLSTENAVHMYVCGPTVYGIHLGNCRTFISF